MKNKKLFEKMKKDIINMNDNHLQTTVKHLNTADNIFSFEKNGINTKELMIFCIKLLLKKKKRIPSQGYYNLIKISGNL